jgi:hypothetical protein
LALPHAERGVHFFQHAQHGAVHPRELGGEDDAFAGVPQQVNVAGGQCIGIQPHPCGGFVGVKRVGAHHPKVFAEPGAGQAVEQRHHQRVYPAHPQGTVQALLLVQCGFQASQSRSALACLRWVNLS